MYTPSTEPGYRIPLHSVGPLDLDPASCRISVGEVRTGGYYRYDDDFRGRNHGIASFKLCQDGQGSGTLRRGFAAESSINCAWPGIILLTCQGTDFGSCLYVCLFSSVCLQSRSSVGFVFDGTVVELSRDPFSAGRQHEWLR